MKSYFLLIIFSFFIVSASLQSCSKQTCPTYATSGPTKGVKKALRKGSIANSKKDKRKNKRTTKGKAASGL